MNDKIEFTKEEMLTDVLREIRSLRERLATSLISGVLTSEELTMFKMALEACLWDLYGGVGTDSPGPELDDYRDKHG